MFWAEEYIAHWQIQLRLEEPPCSPALICMSRPLNSVEIEVLVRRIRLKAPIK